MTQYNTPYLPTTLSETLQTLAKGNLVLLQSANNTNRLPVKSYVDLMFLIADIIAVSRLALEHKDSASSTASVSRLLGMAQELIPYDEADLLDWLRESFILNEGTFDPPIENFFLTKPSSLLDN